jgi:hypothetical protein
MVTSISRDLPEKVVNAPHLGDIMNQLKSEGKIVEERGKPDLLSLLQQIGGIPA